MQEHREGMEMPFVWPLKRDVKKSPEEKPSGLLIISRQLQPASL